MRTGPEHTAGRETADAVARSLNDAALADRLRRVASASSWSRVERDAYLREAADRLDELHTIADIGRHVDHYADGTPVCAHCGAELPDDTPHATCVPA